MAVAYETSNGSSGGAASTSITFAFTVTAGNMLIVGCGERGTPSGVTYAGISMTALGAFNNGGSNNGNMFYLYQPATGSNNVVESHSAGYSAAMAVSLTGSASVPANYTTNTGNSTTPSVTLASTTDSIVVDWCIHNQGSILTATGTGQTRRYHLEQANAVAGSTTTGATSTVPSYSCASGNVWSMGAVSVQPPVTDNGNFLMFI